MDAIFPESMLTSGSGIPQILASTLDATSPSVYWRDVRFEASCMPTDESRFARLSWRLHKTCFHPPPGRRLLSAPEESIDIDSVDVDHWLDSRA